jgi:hypothetical protein
MKIFIAFLFLVMNSANASGKKEHRHHKAHVHGAANLDIVFDKLEGRLEFKTPSESVLGFEYQPKSEKDKKKLSDVIAKFETEIAQMIQFDSSLGCSITKEKIEMILEETGHKHHGTHSDFVAHFKVRCEKQILGSSLKIDFTSSPKIKKLNVTFLAGDLQKSFEIKKKPLTVELK